MLADYISRLSVWKDYTGCDITGPYTCQICKASDVSVEVMNGKSFEKALGKVNNLSIGGTIDFAKEDLFIMSHF